MAKKQTFVYKIMMGHNGKYEKEAYAYARNSAIAIYNINEQFKDDKFDTYKTIMFAEADINKHPGPFEVMPEDEAKYIHDNKLASEEAYSYRKNSPPAGGTFVTKEQLGDVL